MMEKVFKDHHLTASTLLMTYRFVFLSLLVGLVSFISACTEYAQGLRIEQANRLTGPVQLIRDDVTTKDFPLAIFARISDQGGEAVVYIEGEPRGATNSHDVRFDPTPLNPIALKMAVSDDSKNVIYISQPCAYITFGVMRHCDRSLFTSDRFSKRVVDGYSEVLARYRKLYNIAGFHVVGYSGGGAIATLLAKKHSEVVSLRTVAGVLDTDVANDLTQTDSFSGSLNPAKDAFTLGALPQHHFIGDKDEFVPPEMLSSYVQAIGPSRCVRTSLITGASHRDGWVDKWPALKEMPVDCAANNVQYELRVSGDNRL